MPNALGIGLLGPFRCGTRRGWNAMKPRIQRSDAVKPRIQCVRQGALQEPNFMINLSKAPEQPG